MSVRTIVEINHDFGHSIKINPIEFCSNLMTAINSGSTEAWQDLERFGFRRIEAMHHSTPLSIVVDGRVVEVRK